MAEKRFKSKVDIWILLLIIAMLAVDVVLIVALAMDASVAPAGKTGGILVFIVLMALIASLALRTYYGVDKKFLRVVCGPFRWEIPLDQITSVTPTRTLLASPAMSLDRLKIEYGKLRPMVVSPADKDGFLRAIGHDES
jgi:hypothetical protein